MTIQEAIKGIPILLEHPFLSSGDRLVCFGDSITEAEEIGGYVPVLRNALAPLGIETINAGVGGDKTTTALPRIFRDVVDRKPTAVSLFFGTNDAIHGHGRWSHEPSVAWQTLRDNLKWMVHICRLQGIRKFSINILPGENEGAVLAEYGTRYNYIQATRYAAEETGAVAVPLDYVFRLARKELSGQEDSEGRILTVDGLHMTKFGGELIAETMLHCWNMEADLS